MKAFDAEASGGLSGGMAATKHRPLGNEEDVERVRELLAGTYAQTPLGFNWDVRRWDGQRFYGDDPALQPAWAATVQLWETFGGTLVGAVCLEGDENETRTANLFIEPGWRGLEAQMLDWAEEVCLQDSSRAPALEVFVFDYDSERQTLLEGRGYMPTPHSGVIRRMRLAARSVETPVLAPGYTLRTTSDATADDPAADDFMADGLRGDAQRIADLLNVAFGRDFHTAQEYITFTQYAPSFRRDLDLVAVAPDGSFAAYVGVPYDAANRRGIFEPVCTHPAHRRLGLAQALMQEGLRRLQAVGAETVTVETGDAEAANRLYDSLGFDEVVRGRVWRKSR